MQLLELAIMNGTYRDAVPQPGATFVINTPRMYYVIFCYRRGCHGYWSSSLTSLSSLSSSSLSSSSSSSVYASSTTVFSTLSLMIRCQGVGWNIDNKHGRQDLLDKHSAVCSKWRDTKDNQIDIGDSKQVSEWERYFLWIWYHLCGRHIAEKWTWVNVPSSVWIYMHQITLFVLKYAERHSCLVCVSTAIIILFYFY